MEQEFEGVRDPAGDVLKAVATVLLLGLVVAAVERSLAPLMMERPDDRTHADVLETDAVYHHSASYSTEPDSLLEPPKDFSE